jgi:hypothetical protein
MHADIDRKAVGVLLGGIVSLFLIGAVLITYYVHI